MTNMRKKVCRRTDRGSNGEEAWEDMVICVCVCVCVLESGCACVSECACVCESPIHSCWPCASLMLAEG